MLIGGHDIVLSAHILSLGGNVFILLVLQIFQRLISVSIESAQNKPDRCGYFLTHRHLLKNLVLIDRLRF